MNDLEKIKIIVENIKKNMAKKSKEQHLGVIAKKLTGTGLNFKDHQLYIPGDDYRFIDWKVYARTDIPYIKKYESDKSGKIVVMFDLNPSMTLGLDGVMKYDAVLEMIFLIYIIAHKFNDKVQTVFFCNKVFKTKFSNGECGIREIVGLLLKNNFILNDGIFNIEKLMHLKKEEDVNENEIKKYLGKSFEVIIFSDLVDFCTLPLLKRLKVDRHVKVMRIVSPIELLKKVPFTLNYLGMKKLNSLNLNRASNSDLFTKQIVIGKTYLHDFIDAL